MVNFSFIERTAEASPELGEPFPHTLPRLSQAPLPGLKASLFMVTLLVILHILVCIFLIGVVLLQQGKSGDMASAFGGAGANTAFGPRGASNLLTKLTTWSAIIFMFTSIGLTIALTRSNASGSVLSNTPSSRSTPAKK